MAELGPAPSCCSPWWPPDALLLAPALCCARPGSPPSSSLRASLLDVLLAPDAALGRYGVPRLQLPYALCFLARASSLVMLLLQLGPCSSRVPLYTCLDLLSTLSLFGCSSPELLGICRVSLHLLLWRATLLCQAGRRPCLRLFPLVPRVTVAQYMCCAIRCWSNQRYASFSDIATAAPLLLAVASSLLTMLGHLPSSTTLVLRRQEFE